MSLDYTADRTATQAPAPAPGNNATPILRLPVDGEANAVASIYQEFKSLADFGDWLTHHGAWRDIASTISAFWTYSAGVEFDAGATMESTANTDTNLVRQTNTTPTHKKAIDQWQVKSNLKARWFADKDNVGAGLVLNAYVDAAGTTWSADDNASEALRFLATNAQVLIQRHAAAASWAEGAWTTIATFDGATGNLTLSGGLVTTGVTSSGSIVSTAGSLQANTNIIAGTDVSAGTTLNAQTARSSATAGAGQSVAAGEIWKDTAPRAWAYVANPAGVASLTWGVNIASVSRTGAGVVRVTVQSGAANQLCPVPAVVGAGHAEVIVISTTVFDVYTYNGAGAATDRDFTVIVMAG